MLLIVRQASLSETGGSFDLNAPQLIQKDEQIKTPATHLLLFHGKLVLHVFSSHVTSPTQVDLMMVAGYLCCFIKV